MVRQYWDSLHSIKDEEDPTAKGEPIAGLNGRDRDGALVVALRKVPMTTTTSTEPYTFYVCEELHRKERLEEVKTHCRAGPKEFYVDMVDDIVESRAAYGELADLLREKMEENAPPTSRIAELLESIEQMARRITGIVEGGAEGEQAGEGGVAVGPGGAMVGSREQALQTLLNVADFFESREPQAPIAATLREAVRRARMPLQELLSELLPDEAARNLLLMNAGIRPVVPKPEEQQQ
jgi:type VI secretion system protein ImpA